MNTAAARSRSTARFLRGALLCLFAAATILPFCSSFFMCAMPCCHRAAAPQSALNAPMPACPGSSTEGCAPTISAAVDRTAAASVVQTVTIAKAAVVIVGNAAPPPARETETAGTPPLASSAPLHVLNSVFRI